MPFNAILLEHLQQSLLSSNSSRFTAVAVLTVVYVLYIRYATPLRKIPGPFIASITKLWIVQNTRGFQRQFVDIDLRTKYGPVVRVGPSEVLVTGTQALKTIYGATANFPKGEWYKVAGSPVPESLSFFVEWDMEKLRVQRRAIGPAYTSEAMKDLEPNIDFVLKKNLEIMKMRSGEVVDIDVWCAMFVLDCITMMTFSEEKGLIEAGKDDGSIRATQDIWYYMHVMGYFPWLHWAHNRILGLFKVDRTMYLRKMVAMFSRDKSKPPPKHPYSLARNSLAARFARRDDTSPNTGGFHEKDIVAKLLQLQSEKSVLTDRWITDTSFSNFGAGIDTTATTISVLLNDVARHPDSKERVRRELEAARKEGKLSSPPKLGEMKQHLPFLNACLKESARLYPVVGTPLWRTVPETGLEFEGYYLPPGTTIGVNPWVIHREKSIYGDDADEWRPERWLEHTPEELRRIESFNMTFGAGLRSCPGKHLAEAIYTKVIPMLLAEFDWSLENPKQTRFIQCTFETRLIKEMMVYKKREESG